MSGGASASQAAGRVLVYQDSKPPPPPPPPHLTQDRESRNEMLSYLRTISVSSSKLLLAAKALSADPNAPNVMNQLAAAARAVTDAINMLLNLCSTSGPGQKECDNALRNIEVGGAGVTSVILCVFITS